MTGSVLPESLLHDAVREAAALPPGGALPPGVRVQPASGPDRGDLSTQAALICARAAGCSAPMLAEAVAERLRLLAVVGDARVAGNGFINLVLTDAALCGIVPALLARPAMGPPPRAITMRHADIRHSNPEFVVQHAHARCRSLARACDLQPGLTGADWSGLLSGGTRRLLCLLDHWWRMGDRTRGLSGELEGPVGRYLVAVSRQLDQVWKHPVDGAKLRALRAGPPTRGLAHLSLVLATAWVIRDGLAALGMAAAEEIR